jgi:hypothetical protein
MIGQGEQAPDFELADQDGPPLRLSGLRGRRVVLDFYPRPTHRAATPRPAPSATAVIPKASPKTHDDIVFAVLASL